MSVKNQLAEQQSQSLLHVLNKITDGFYIVNRKWEIIYLSPKAQTLASLTDEHVGRVLWECFPDAIQSIFYVEYHRAFSENTLVSFEAYSPRARIWCQVQAYPHNDHLFVYIQDISKRIEQEKRLEFMAKATSEVIWERTLDSDTFYICSERFNQLFGYQLNSDWGNPVEVWRDRIHPDDRRKIKENHAYAFAHGIDFYFNEYRFLKADQTWAYVKDRTLVIRDRFGNVVRYMGAMEDISRERLAELALRERELTYRQIFHNSPIPSLVFDLETHRFLEVNKAAEALYGYSHSEFLELTVYDIRPPYEYERTRSAITAMCADSNKSAGVFTYRKKNGEELLANASLSTIVFRGQKAGMAMLQDITEKEKLRKQLLETQAAQQKRVTQAVIEAQEQQRNVIAQELHDNVNQILTAAKLYVENSVAFPGQGSRFSQKSIEMIQAAINEIRSLTRQLGTPGISEEGVEEALRALVDSYTELRPFALNFSYQLQGIQMDLGLQLTLYRIIQELLNNAVKYANASEVTITLCKEQQLLKLRYSDNGIGFDTSSRQKGIGMKNIKHRAEAYMGKIRINTAVGKGCVIDISFPV